MKYKIPQTVSVGGLGKTKRIEIGGTSPVSIQTMWKEGIIPVLSDNNVLDSILLRIDELSRVGCDLIRFAVPDMESAKALCLIAENTSMPLVADIHFDYKLALECLKGNVAAIRINPGNIGSEKNTKIVIDACKDNGVAIRIGINSGSYPKELQEKVANGLMTRAEALCETAVLEAAIFEKNNFLQ